MGEYVLDQAVRAAGAQLADVRGWPMVADYGDVRAEYQAATTAVGLYDARDRGLIEVTGKDCLPWLHNLVTNAVKTLQVGQGNYAFALNVKGRILFDLNLLVLEDALWLDVDRRFLPKAIAHLNKYLIMEDARLTDRSDASVRLALLGPQARRLTDALGASHAAVMGSLSWTRVLLAEKPRLLVRHDFAGVFGVEFYVEAADAPACWAQLLAMGQTLGLRPIGHTAIDLLQIEAGLPVYGRDIDEEILPPETQQLERAVSYVKGCYLGQEVVERMRSRGSLARRLMGVSFAGEVQVPQGAKLVIEDKEAGRLTSSCFSFALQRTIGLAYVRNPFWEPGTMVKVEANPPVEGQVCALPFRASAS